MLEEAGEVGVATPHGDLAWGLGALQPAEQEVSKRSALVMGDCGCWERY